MIWIVNQPNFRACITNFASTTEDVEGLIELLEAYRATDFRNSTISK